MEGDIRRLRCIGIYLSIIFCLWLVLVGTPKYISIGDLCVSCSNC